jgi:hypothetical protein
MTAYSCLHHFQGQQGTATVTLLTLAGDGFHREEFSPWKINYAARIVRGGFLGLMGAKIGQ